MTTSEIKHFKSAWGDRYELYLDDDPRAKASLLLPTPGQTRFGEAQEPEINWSALGPQSADVATAFANGLLELLKKIPAPKDPQQ